MTEYIVCHKKRNAPRINVRICREKCPQREECKTYLAHLKSVVVQHHVTMSNEKTAFGVATAP